MALDDTADIDKTNKPKSKAGKSAKPKSDKSSEAKPKTPKLQLFKLSNAREAQVILPLVREWYAESRYAHLPFSEKKFMSNFVAVLNNEREAAGFFVAYKGRVVGMIQLIVGEAYLSDGGRIASSLAWFVAPDIRQTFLGGKVAVILMRQARDWCKAKGATELTIHGTHGQMTRVAKGAEIIGANVVVKI